MRHAIALALRAWLVLSLFALMAGAQEKTAQPREVHPEDPGLLSFDELVTLSSTAKPEGQLAARLDSLLTTPFVHNDASAAGVQPHHPTVANLGPALRVGFWNIERGLNFELIRSALTDTNDFERLEGNQGQISDTRKALIDSQLASLQNVDVLVLNEVDLGMKRTEYRDVARDLAAALRELETQSRLQQRKHRGAGPGLRGARHGVLGGRIVLSAQKTAEQFRPTRADCSDGNLQTEYKCRPARSHGTQDCVPHGCRFRRRIPWHTNYRWRPGY